MENEIILFAQQASNVGSMWKDNSGRIELRIHKCPDSYRLNVGACMSWGHIECAVKDGYKITILP